MRESLSTVTIAKLSLAKRAFLLRLHKLGTQTISFRLRCSIELKELLTRVL